MPSFEEALARLEALVEELESPDVPLERALALFEEGIAHLRTATAELTRAEASVKVLVAKAGGVLTVNEING
jgi:exodeoxyribonuclease VII small subunit